jgi:hypothetical protein
MVARGVIHPGEHLAEDRIKIGRLIEAMTGGTALVESMHGAGSPQAQRVMILREGDLEKKVKLAKASPKSRRLGPRKRRPRLRKRGRLSDKFPPATPLFPRGVLVKSISLTIMQRIGP